jgi:hypothetical protein
MENKINNPNYKKECELLNMSAVPTFGVYSPDYTFFVPVNILHTSHIDEHLCDTFPRPLQNSFLNFIQSYNVPTDYFLMCLDGSLVYSKYYYSNTDNIRINAVLHPYIFENVKSLSKDHQTVAFTSLYKNDYFDNIIDTYEDDGLRINPDSFVGDVNKKEVILHNTDDNTPALSPNNSAFLINLDDNLIRFYLVSAITYNKKIVRLMIAECTVVTNQECILTSPLLKTMNQFSGSQGEDFREVLNEIDLIVKTYENALLFINGYAIDSMKSKSSIKDSIVTLFRTFTNSLNDNESRKGEFYYSHLCNYIWKGFNKPSIPNFGESVLLDDYNDNGLMVFSCLFKYIKYQIDKFKRVMPAYVQLLGLSSSKPNNTDRIKATTVEAIKNLYTGVENITITEDLIGTYIAVPNKFIGQTSPLTGQLSIVLEACFSVSVI